MKFVSPAVPTHCSNWLCEGVLRTNDFNHLVGHILAETAAAPANSSSHRRRLHRRMPSERLPGGIGFATRRAIGSGL